MCQFFYCSTATAVPYSPETQHGEGGVSGFSPESQSTGDPGPDPTSSASEATGRPHVQHGPAHLWSREAACLISNVGWYRYLRAKKVLSDASLPPLPLSLENRGAEGRGEEKSRHSPGFGWRYSIVLVNTSVTALLVRSTFCRKDKMTQQQ